MSQNGTKNKGDENKKPVLVRGIQPSTKKWLERRINEDQPSMPKVIRRIVEDVHRQEIEERKRKR